MKITNERISIYKGTSIDEITIRGDGWVAKGELMEGGVQFVHQKEVYWIPDSALLTKEAIWTCELPWIKEHMLIRVVREEQS